MTKSHQITLSEEEGELLRAAGYSGPYEVCQLKEGRNNQVFEVVDGNAQKVVLKRYFHHPGDKRDRLAHEWKFLTYAKQVTPEFVPQPVAKSDHARVALIEWIDGSGFNTPPSENEVLAAIDFVCELNQFRLNHPTPELPLAAEACFSGTDHLRLLRRRLLKLSQIEDPEVQEFIRMKLTPAAEAILAHAEDDRQDTREGRIISPSDFGFHNAILRPDRAPCFIDFEYAGWDGSAKMMCDFLLQPDIPIPDWAEGKFLDSLRGYLADPEFIILKQKLPVNKAIHAMKWCCILLNGFLNEDAKRRSFSGSKSSREDQFSRVIKYFSRTEPTRIGILNTI